MIVVYLVENKNCRFISTSKVFQRIVDDLDLLLEVGMRDVNDMQQEVSLAHLVERRLERVDQVGRQLADEPHRVGEQERQITDDNLSDGRVEGCKELVLSKDITLGQEVHQRRLAHVGIAHECRAYEPSAVLSLGALLPVDLSQAFLE